MDKKYYFPIILGIILIVFGFYYFGNFFGGHEISIDGREYKVELAITKEEQEMGLMNRTSLDPNSGMLFVFKEKLVQKFWNEGTLIPLDVIWISGDKVVGVSTLHDISAGLEIVDSIEPVDYALELPFGTALENNIHIGSEVKIKL
jgi:uncharacterized protein